MKVPTHDPRTGSAWVRYIRLSRKDVTRRGYPLHPRGLYVSLKDMRRAAAQGATIQQLIDLVTDTAKKFE